MNPEERMERIERALGTLAQVQSVHAENLGQLIGAVNVHVDWSHAAIGELTTTISKFVEGSDARMRRLEENLDALIRAITAEHSNGHRSN
jgi:hypothetical protein